MATYREIQGWVKRNFGFVPKTCWIAHVKELVGLDPRPAPSRQSVRTRLVPCPKEKQEPIRRALAHFKMI